MGRLLRLLKPEDLPVIKIISKLSGERQKCNGFTAFILLHYPQAAIKNFEK
jgi:hypothetical protein